jgi:hypothetical protein
MRTEEQKALALEVRDQILFHPESHYQASWIEDAAQGLAFPTPDCHTTRGHDPLVDVRDQEDARQNYLAGYTTSEQPSRGSHTGEGLRVIAKPGCWWNEPYGHDWPGKAEGQPHPR